MVEPARKTRVYLDVCCLNRPFDDQHQERVRLEAEAVLLILGRCEAETWQWVSSVVVEDEVDQTPSPERRARVRAMLPAAQLRVGLTDVIVARAKSLHGLGFHPYDALHLACAEQAAVDVFLTTDDRVLRVAASRAALLQVRVVNPLVWLVEVTET